MIVTLCGSTRFKEKFLEVNQSLTLDGHIVLMPGVFGHADGIELTVKQKTALDELHQQKIMMSDAIIVLNVDGYVGQSTRSEVAYAERIGRAVHYLYDAV